MAAPTADLLALVEAELQQPVLAEVAAMAAAIASRHRTARAVLFYGSCLREQQLDGLMLDFYLIVGDYSQAFGPRWLAAANRLLPPNVFPFEHEGLVAKYAVLSEKDFARLASRKTRNVSVWARFAQPSRLVWSADKRAIETAVTGVAHAAPALLCAARASLPDVIAPLDMWRQAFALTYSAELRAERKGRATSVVDADPDRYRRFTLPALASAGIAAHVNDDHLTFDRPLSDSERKQGVRDWRRRRREGKALTLARLAKASATYAGGIDYLAWKISRHSGQPVAIKPWQRRFPILGAMALLPRLIVKGAVR
ncbi:hypothetical protein FHS31_000502 [Sphingomonas vulcanisoli]|uniref:Phosphatidate cytidylyltransferase n=1 Tax=Sphingomonas vulcanisoli TaxID=1658060 RepID=A0ABX0TQQ4_9SPHN|nr:hypothetical protein [Sphingomonas vulcanisoli]NIJ06920.1 hypothetical protein [Sphingomonas vulcanisoli]